MQRANKRWVYRRFSSIVEEINGALDQGPGQLNEAITSNKREQDRYVNYILRALQSGSDKAMGRTLSSKNIIGPAILSSLFRQTYSNRESGKVNQAVATLY